MNETTSPIPPFWGFSAFTPTIPKLYWNVKSQEQRILNLFDLLNKLVCYAEQMGIQLNVSQDELEKLKAEFEKFQGSGFEDYYEKQLAQWMQDNAATLFQLLAKQVYFGLTDDGHFCAYIPDSWSDVTFDTGAVYGQADYGRLILRFDADGTGVINNTQFTTVENYNTLDVRVTNNEKKIAALEVK
jgi:hypothetical protein